MEKERGNNNSYFSEERGRELALLARKRSRKGKKGECDDKSHEKTNTSRNNGVSSPKGGEKALPSKKVDRQ